MVQIKFYKDQNGKSPIEDFLNDLNSKQALKVTWVLNLIEEHDNIPKSYLKKLKNTNNIWEVRVQSGNNAYRLMCFKYMGNLIILTNGFHKKTQKTPRKEILLAEKRKADWLRRNTK